MDQPLTITQNDQFTLKLNGNDILAIIQGLGDLPNKISGRTQLTVEVQVLEQSKKSKDQKPEDSE